MEGIECVVISDDEEEDEKFKADLELAKNLSLQVSVAKNETCDMSTFSVRICMLQCKCQFENDLIFTISPVYKRY
jgi:hypothetical protein